MEQVILKCEKVGTSISEIRLGIEGLSKMVKAHKSPIQVVKITNINVDDNHQDHNIIDHIIDEHDRCSLNIPTKSFISLCNLVIQVLDKIGPTMAVMRQDVHQNIQRLEKVNELSDGLGYSNLVEILKKEKKDGIARKGNSCSRALVWLTRSLDFTATLLQKLVKDKNQSMEIAVEETYNITLKPWHRWISSAAFRVALKLVPNRETFMSLLLAKEDSYESLEEEIQTFVLLLVPFLEDIHSVMRFYGLDRIKST